MAALGVITLDKIFFRNIEALQGITARASDLSRSPFYAKNLTNCQFSFSKAVKKRNGFQCIGQAGGFVGGHNYIYFDAETGETKEELLAINDNLWKLKEASFVITRTGAAAWTTEVVQESGQFVFKLKEGSSTILSNNLGTGLEDIAWSIEDLRQTIDALANYSCSGITRWGKVNGLQTGVSVITVSSHNYVVGDILTLWNYSTNKLEKRTITAQTGTTLTFLAAEGTVNVKDLQWLGTAACPAATLPVTVTGSTSSTTITISFWYWDYIYHDYIDPLAVSRTPFYEMYQSKTSSFFTPPSFANVENICLIGYYDQSTSTHPGDAAGRIFKYDGQSVYRAGLPKAVVTKSAGTHGLPVSVGVGNTKIKVRYKQYDKRGRVTYGNPSDPLTITTNSVLLIPHPAFAEVAPDKTATVSGNQAGVNTITIVTGHGVQIGNSVVFYDGTSTTFVRRTVTDISHNSITVSGGVVTVLTGQMIYTKIYEKFHGYFDIVASTSGSPSTTIDVDDSAFQAGDPITYPEYDGGFGGLVDHIVRRTVAVAVSTNIAADANTLVLSGEFVSKGMTVEIFMTQAGGNKYYKACEAPVCYTPTSALGPEIEAIVSAAVHGDQGQLGEELDEPPLGFEWDLPPKAKYLTVFQGIPVASGDNLAPNSVYWADVENFEGWPLATNVASVNSRVQGPVTAIGAASDDELFIFKRNATYSLYGSLATSELASRTLSDGIWGVSAHNSLVNVGDSIIGVGPLGVLRISQGRLDRLVGYDINPLIRKDAVLPGSTGLMMQMASAIADSANNGYRLYIPYSSFTSGSASSALGLFLDLDRPDIDTPVWLDESFTNSIDPNRGWVLHKSVPHFLSDASGGSLAAAKAGHFFKEVRIAGAKAYYDNHLAITQTVRLADLSFDEPWIEKQFLWIALYAFVTAADLPNWVANTITVNTYKDWQESTVSTTFTAPYAASTTTWHKQKLASDKAKALRVVMTNAVAGESMYFSGAEYVVAMVYQKEEGRK